MVWSGLGFDEAPFDGVSPKSVHLAIDMLRSTADQFAAERELDKSARLEVVMRALEDTLLDKSIDWVIEES